MMYSVCFSDNTFSEVSELSRNSLFQLSEVSGTYAAEPCYAASKENQSVRPSGAAPGATPYDRASKSPLVIAQNAVHLVGEF